jgi:phosphoserine phosphatase
MRSHPARTANALRFVLERHASETEAVVFVGHESVNRALLLQFLDQPFSAYWRIAQEPCAINEINMLDGRICVQRMNETHHLERVA